MAKVYVFINSHSMGNLEGLAIAEDGTVLAGHLSSSEAWVQHDLGVRPDGWERNEYAAHYPDGFEVEYVPEDRIDGHLGLQYAFQQHRAV